MQSNNRSTVGGETGGGMGRRERRREATRGQIIGAAKVLFEEKSYEEVTIDEITNRADVAKGTFYLHFRTKEDLASGVYNDLIQPAAQQASEQINKVAASARELLTAFFQASAAPAEANPNLARAVFSYGMSQAYAELQQGDEEHSPFAAALEKIVAFGQSSGELRTDRHVTELALMLSVLFATTVWMWVAAPSSGRLQALLERCLQTCLEGMAVLR